MKDVFIPANVRGEVLRAYFMEHVKAHKVMDSCAIYTVTKPLHVFKKATSYRSDRITYVSNCLVNLVIPVGAFVYAMDEAFVADALGDTEEVDLKMRASEACVHSIIAYDTNDVDVHGLVEYFYQDDTNFTGELRSDFQPDLLEPATVAFSEHDSSFTYKPGRIVRPTKDFDMRDTPCGSGIHFFLNVRDALGY